MKKSEFNEKVKAAVRAAMENPEWKRTRVFFISVSKMGLPVDIDVLPVPFKNEEWIKTYEKLGKPYNNYCRVPIRRLVEREDTKFANLYFNEMGCNFEEDDKPSLNLVKYNETFDSLYSFVEDLDAFDDFIRDEVTDEMNEETIKTKFFKHFNIG